MLRAEVRRHVLQAVDRDDLPRGGPSELAALDLLEETPAHYLERWGQEAAERIRARAVECRCFDGGVPHEGHCQRCYGRRAS
ncbi:MAG TPA: hypothetical protein VK304_00495 [Thermoleophilaceae bacterium]|nr:hypothetical protein [Thermoleophilaceae bacterium]